MSVNLLRCSMSLWTGGHDRCRWCDRRSPGVSRRWRFCSRLCTAAYADNHLYARAKWIVLEASRRPCPCPPEAGIVKRWYDPQSERVVTDVIPPPHRHCTGDCGRCEGQIQADGDRLTVNHVDPRLGIGFQALDCIHHQDNLEPLCWSEHHELNLLLNERLRRR